MLRSSDNCPNTTVHRANMHNVASSPLLSHSTDRALISSMGHPLLNCGIDHDANPVARIIDLEKAAQGDLAPITRLSAKDLPSFCPVAFRTSQSPNSPLVLRGIETKR